jgi:site-specific DNA-methyltransferase (cytosine-N4-specific)
MDFIDSHAYSTPYGRSYIGDSLELLEKLDDNSVNLVITSPPFALQRKKEYGNKNQEEYVEWFLQFAKLVREKLTEDGSFVVDFGGAYEKGVPVRSLYNFRVLIKLIDDLDFRLAEDFYWFNPSKLPSPIEWVNKRKIRVKDSVNTVWWLSKSDFPKSDVTKVLAPYSDRMKKLIKNPEKYYTAKDRPSGHNISKSFGKDNGGSIPPNLLTIANSNANSSYQKLCKTMKIKSHPARFPPDLPEFFIKMLTNEGDTVIDIFGGSNTTGMVCEDLKRKWMSFEQVPEYVAASSFRFLDRNVSFEDLEKLYNLILQGEQVDIDDFKEQYDLLI